jgi:hypothetical protein
VSNTELLDKLVGTGMSHESMIDSFSDFEKCELRRLTRKCGFSDNHPTYRGIVVALYRFKQVLRHYAWLWWDLLPLSERQEYTPIFAPVRNHLDDNDRHCFAHNQFFGKINFLLNSCKVGKVSDEHRNAYMKMVCSFPVIPCIMFTEVYTHEIWPANLPHTFMHMVAGLIGAELTRRRSHKRILGIYRTFLRERHISKAHTRWFKTRLAGSYGSRQ